MSKCSVALCKGVIHIVTENKKQKILIADDSEMNRAILADMLGDEYEIIEAENGVQAVAIIQKYSVDLSLLLLDIVMPEMDGFGVLKLMNRNHWIDELPVMIISADTATSTIERAYEMGVSDFISRPFDAMIVRKRVVNTILLYSKQKRLVHLVADQIYEKEQRSNLMIDILSHIMGFKNGESAQHVLSVRILTEMLLTALVNKTDAYGIELSDISDISIASALHDIGKVGIPDGVINKPGKLTDEEFATMKTHSMIGAQILEDLPIYKEEPIVKVAYEICRWHHERYDGRGYPDGLKGDEIPISAQIVALADVYDALTSERVYKPSYAPEQAVKMITNGECGVFNPILLECLTDIADDIQSRIKNNIADDVNKHATRDVVEHMLRHRERGASDRTLHLLEQERIKNGFYATLTQEIQFEYTDEPPMLSLSSWGAEKLGLGELISDPLHNKTALDVISEEDMQKLSGILRNTVQGDAPVKYECKIKCDGEERWFRIAAMALWSDDETPQYTGFIGKAIDIHDSRTKMDNLERMASHDSLTGLYTHAHTKKLIAERIEARPDGKYALAILDCDYFKRANDNYGHMFGDQVIIHMAHKIQQSIRGSDIAARVGGDEFLIFLDYKMDLEPIINRIYHSLLGEYEGFKISISMGISSVNGGEINYDRLFHEADQALYKAKKMGRGRFFFYDDSMSDMLSVLSPIESDEEER